MCIIYTAVISYFIPDSDYHHNDRYSNLFHNFFNNSIFSISFIDFSFLRPLGKIMTSFLFFPTQKFLPYV